MFIIQNKNYIYKKIQEANNEESVKDFYYNKKKQQNEIMKLVNYYKKMKNIGGESYNG